MQQLHKFGLVMSANFETVGALVAAYYATGYLNENYPKEFDWSSVTYVLALLLIVRAWYVMLRTLIRDQKASAAAPSAKMSESNNDNRS